MMTFKEAQRQVDAWITSFAEGYWGPLSLLARLTEEVGELAREVNHRFGEKPKKPDEPEGELARELADILFVVLAFANAQQIDMDEAFNDMMNHVRARDANRWTPKEKA